MKRNPLTDIVDSLDLVGAIFLSADFTAPWSITSHVTEKDCAPYMSIPGQIIAYHIVTEGEAVVSLDTSRGHREYCRAKPGDVIFLPSNPLHVLSSEGSRRPACGHDLLLPSDPDGLARIAHGGGGDRTRILCGFIGSNTVPSPLFDMLPELLVISIESLETRSWIEASVAMAARELASGRHARDMVASALCRLLLIEALRTHIETNPTPVGWLSGMAHPRIARALARIHADVSNPPRVEDLAKHVGMSRSSFVDRFSEVMGVGPRKYVLAQRISTAKSLLRETELPTAAIAFRVGYDAPEAFSRAFKKETGTSPAAWRTAEKRALWDPGAVA
ncbi:AraC family transcriptional regulator [Roseobacter sp. YSTF-M11]|uniref:AraC family transcriptional regulator n=1 Tax=Roseobacter insulae TaxID=2859783 RepID=A0A9X1FWP3_9RHOB|nr:AraC family transcriptional regulator [Roseobacter insulae]MBW4709027.1 AraC family transcriptional regulator [Roseobacter insulae]